MKHITFYLDFISPYAYLAFEHLPDALEGLSYSVSYKPVLFAGMLKHYGQLGPAEIAPKRDWTYRQVLWLAQKMGVDLQLPQSHPFNPLPLLRLAAQCGMAADQGGAGADGSVAINRYVCENIFRHVWLGGAEAADPQRLDALAQQLASQQRLPADEAKTALKNNTAEAIAENVFGVPAFVVDGRVFWGLDALPMLRDYLLESPWFGGPDWESVCQVSVGVSRRAE
ncbi:MAG: 2-hydroxychromene-2-carboxylate isomerase [Pseudomonadota bacterium]